MPFKGRDFLRFARNLREFVPTSLPVIPVQLRDLRNNEKTLKIYFCFSVWICAKHARLLGDVVDEASNGNPCATSTWKKCGIWMGWWVGGNLEERRRRGGTFQQKRALPLRREWWLASLSARSSFLQTFFCFCLCFVMSTCDRIELENYFWCLFNTTPLPIRKCVAW